MSMTIRGKRIFGEKYVLARDLHAFFLEEHRQIVKLLEEARSSGDRDMVLKTRGAMATMDTVCEQLGELVVGQ